MKTKYLFLTPLLLALTVFLGGCATGMTASSWSGVTADAKNAYIAGGSRVYAVDLQTGAQVWRYPDKASANPFFAAPVLTPEGQLIVGGFDKKLYSLNSQTGQSNWQFTAAKDRWIGGVLVVNKTIYAPNADYNLYALDLNGNLLWKFGADQAIWGAPVSDGASIYFGTLGRKVYAIDAKTGKQVWVQKLDGAVLGAPVIGADEVLYLGTFAGTIYGLDRANGAVRWSETTTSWIWSGPSVNGTMIYYGNGSGALYAYPLTDADQAWNQPLNGAITGTPLVSENNIIVGTEAGNVYFIETTGKNPRPIAVSGKIYSSPIAAGSLILIAPTDGNAILVALDLDGAVKWSFTPAK